MALDAAHNPDHFEELPSDFHAGDNPLAQRTRLLGPAEARDDDREFVVSHCAISPDEPDDTGSWRYS
jgi:hypothetical protein